MLYGRKIVSMNLLEMTKEQKLEELKKSRLRMEEETMGNAPLMVNDPIDDDKSYLEFIVEGYELDASESGAV